jgi:hypothetical protein
MLPVEIRAIMRQLKDGSWAARIEGDSPVDAAGETRDRCLTSLRRALDWDRIARGQRAVTLVVEVLPRIAGVAEAAEVMGWDKRRVITYIDRGSFPKPFQALASGRVWVRTDVEAFAEAWHARRRPHHDEGGG